MIDEARVDATPAPTATAFRSSSSSKNGSALASMRRKPRSRTRASECSSDARHRAAASSARTRRARPDRPAGRCRAATTRGTPRPSRHRADLIASQSTRQRARRRARRFRHSLRSSAVSSRPFSTTWRCIVRSMTRPRMTTARHRRGGPGPVRRMCCRLPALVRACRRSGWRPCECSITRATSPRTSTRYV